MRSIVATVTVGVLLATSIISTTPAEAIGGDDNTAPVTAEGTADGGATDVAAGSGGGQDKPSKPAKPVYSSCAHHGSLSAALSNIEPFSGLLGEFNIDEKFNLLDVLDATGVNECERIDGSTTDQYLTQEAAPPAADILVAHARSQLNIDLPDIATSPPRGGTQLVGVPVWFWVQNAEPITTTASIPGLAATLTATPANTHITITGGPAQATNDHVTIDCPGPGTPWQPGRYDDYAESDCSHPFDWNGTFTIDATTDWTLTWTATNGQAGTLPDVSRTTTFTLTIQEGQAVTD